MLVVTPVTISVLFVRAFGPVNPHCCPPVQSLRRSNSVLWGWRYLFAVVLCWDTHNVHHVHLLESFALTFQHAEVDDHDRSK